MSSTSERADATTRLGPSLRGQVERFAAQHLLPGVAAGVVVDGAPVWATATGYADLDAGTPMTTATLCQIASVTKPFTATAIMQLRDAGLLSLEDPVVAHVPELGRAVNPFGPIEQITIERLLRHTSGLMGEVPNRDPREWTQLDQADVIATLDRVEVLVRPGSLFRYSNLGFRLVAEVVRRVGGEPWPDRAVDAILRPLGMTASGAFPDEPETRCAAGYGPIGFAGRRERVATIPSRFSEGDGDLWSNVDELLVWVGRQVAAHLPNADDRVVADATLREMHRPTVLADAEWREARCLGWGALRRDGDAGELVMVAHGGLLDGFNTHVCFSPVHRIGVVAVANALPSGSIADLAWALAATVVAELRGLPADTAPVRLDPPPAELVRFLGRYHDVAEGDEARIEFLDGALHCLANDRASRTRMAATGDPLVFRFVEDGVLDRYVTFWLGAADEVEGVSIGGYPLVKLRLPEAREVAW